MMHVSEQPNSWACFGPGRDESWISRHTPYLLLLAYLYYCTELIVTIFDDFFYFYRVLPLIENAIVWTALGVGAVMVVRVVFCSFHRPSWSEILCGVFGEPTWWRTWYPRFLRHSSSVWDRLPMSLKVMRTLVWLDLILLPAGCVLTIFVIPTFYAVFASIGVPAPMGMQILAAAVEIGGYVLPFLLIAAAVQVWRWRKTHEIPLWVALNAFVSVNEDFWRDSDARKLLRGSTPPI